MLISLVRVTSWFDTVCNIVTHCVNFRENHLHEHELQLSDYNIKSNSTSVTMTSETHPDVMMAQSNFRLISSIMQNRNEIHLTKSW